MCTVRILKTLNVIINRVGPVYKTMATAVVRPPEAFSTALAYSLEQLGLSHVVFKEEQRAAIKSMYEGRDVFVCLPTGFGKSLCYQTLPFVLDYKGGSSTSSNAVIVVSPLIALMEDQVSGLRRRGVKSSIITSSAGVTKEYICTEEGLATDNLFFCSPEAIVSPKWLETFERPEFSGRVVALVVDEAHCVSKW